MSVATVLEASPITPINEQADSAQNVDLQREASKKEKERQKKEIKEQKAREKKEKEKREKERKEREKREKKEKKERKVTNESLPQTQSADSETTLVPENTNTKELKQKASLPSLDTKLPDTSNSAPNSPIPVSPTKPTIITNPLILNHEQSINSPSTFSPIKSRETPENENPLQVNTTNLQSVPQSLESAISDATQSNINDITEETSSTEIDSLPIRNWSSAIGQVRGFFSRTVEKINQKLDELDDQLTDQYSDEDLESEGSSIHENSPTSTANLPNHDAPQPVPLTREQSIAEQKQQRQELLGNTPEDNPAPVRGQKMNQLSDKLENMNSASSEFARIAREIAKREANKKWYNIF
ncbi:9246_t:CDS:2 [Ambispora gerdemannii]|uniref:9246_t:CDS:1 n=1 Tax=Ambispora gerdemannii TaxID=144530 RepID=A0A9N8VAK8_9GLOM|nr:9246_t:CDS:2 [Ambispora gerdemannii]